MRHRRLVLTLLIGLAASHGAPGAALAQQAYLQPPPQMDEAGRCTYFSRLQRFTAESKSFCDEGRKVKTGPVTGRILAQCLAEHGPGFDKSSISDMTESFAKQVQAQGMGNACNQVKAQAWDLVAQ